MGAVGDPRIKGTLRDLQRCEAVVDNGKISRLETWNAMLEINERGLYLLTHDDWEAYCADRHGFSRQRGYQMLDFARVSTIVVTIENEGQARVLAGLPDEAQRRIAERAARNGDGTAEGLRAAFIELVKEEDDLAATIEKAHPGRIERTMAQKVDALTRGLRRILARVPGSLDISVELRSGIERLIEILESESC